MTIRHDTIAYVTGGILSDDTAASPTTPTTPTLSITAGTLSVTATIDGDAGATNYIRYKGTGDTDWQDGGNRSGDGNITVSGLSNDIPYIFECYSASGGVYSLSSIPQIITLSADDTDTDFESSMIDSVAAVLDAFGESVTYYPVGGGSRAITAIVKHRGIETTGQHGSVPAIEVKVYNDATEGITNAELSLRDQLKVTMKNGSEQTRTIKMPPISVNAAWVRLELT